jgi:hypothetical protein
MVPSFFGFTLHKGFPLHLIACSLLQETKTGVMPNKFGFIRKMKTRKTPHLETGSMWINEQAETQCNAYVSKFKQKHGESSQPETEDFDVVVAVLAGEGMKHGCLWIGDGLVDPGTIPSLRQIRRGRMSNQPQVETHPRASDLAVERLRVCSFSVLYASLHAFHCNVNDIATTQRRWRWKNLPRDHKRRPSSGRRFWSSSLGSSSR